MKMIGQKLLMVFVGSVVLAKSTPVGKAYRCSLNCYCNRETKWATCNSRKLRYIPKLPPYITKVKFVQNNFPVINRVFFTNLTMHNNITVLNMTDNLIQNVFNDAFTDFRYLLSFGISKEPLLNISVLKESLYSLEKSSLLFLQLSGNEWRTLPMDMFSAFNNSKSRSFNISLAGNKIRNLDFKVFAGLKNLKSLNLAHNSIKDVSLTGIATIQELYLHRNLIRDIPTMCDINNKTLVPNLRYVRLDDNSIAEMDQSSFKCLEWLDKLRLDANNFRTLKNNTFSEIRNLRKLYISNNGRLKNIEDTAFNISSLKILYFKQNHFNFNKGIGNKYNPKTLFKYCPDLEVLDMTENYIPTVGQYSTFKEIFRPLTKLKNLTLSKTEMRALPRDVFPHLKQLEYLNLQNNLLQGWEQSGRIFGSKSSLKVLNLHSNTIRLVNKTTFPPALLRSLRTLDLSDNFFSCTCDLMWFRDWIKANMESETKTYNLSLLGYPKYYKCKLPGEMRGLLLQQFNPTVENCKEKDQLQIIAISIGSFGAFAIIVILISYRCQTNIRNYIYLCRFYKNKKSGYIRLDSDEDYEYHAFIVYCESDREWVHHVCVKRLEEEGLNVCIHHRDFDIGESVTGNIEKYMSKCHKIVVVMSNNFAESEWCQWEVDLVHERRRRQGEGVSMLVMLRSIDSKHMTSRLKALLDSTPHLTYCSGLGEHIFWEALIKGLRKPFGHPPFAVQFNK